MNEDFVTYELAVKLKEKGFDELCLAYYTNDDTLYCNYSHKAGASYTDCYLSHNLMPKNSVSGKFVDAPTISQVLKWLRKEHHLHFEVVGAAYGYNLIISDTPDKGGTDRYYSRMNYDGPNDGGAWDKYEDCVLYGIEYVLDNLI